MRQRFCISLLLLAALLAPSGMEAQGGLGFAKKIVRKVQKFFSNEVALEDMYLLEGKKVIGTDPSFLISGNSYGQYPFNLFSDYVVGEYDLNPETGLPRSENGFSHYQNEKSGEDENILKALRKKSPRANALLLVSYHADYGRDLRENVNYTRGLFDTNSKVVRDSLIKRLKATFVKWQEEYKIPPGKFGVVLDFQIPEVLLSDQSLPKQLGNFASQLKNEGWLVYFKLPADFTRNGIFSNEKVLKDLKPHIDLFIVTSYSLDVNDPMASECTSPVNMAALEATLEENKKGELIPASKLVVEFPGFGRGIKIDSTAQVTYQANMPFGHIVEACAALGEDAKTIYRDSVQYAYAFVKDPLGKQNFCYEDSTTMMQKIQWLDKSGLSTGIGLWGVGYLHETGSKSLNRFWWSVAKGYGKPKTKVGWIYASFIFLFITLGYVFSIMEYWEVRNILAKFSNIFWDHAMRFGIFLLVTLICFNILPRNVVGLLICGLILGIFIVMRIIKRYTAKVRKYSRYAERI